METIMYMQYIFLTFLTTYLVKESKEKCAILNTARTKNKVATNTSNTQPYKSKETQHKAANIRKKSWQDRQNSLSSLHLLRCIQPPAEKQRPKQTVYSQEL